MANVIINSTSEVRLYEDKIIAQMESNSFFAPMIGEKNDDNAFIYRPDEMYKKGRYWTVPLRKAVTDDAIEDGGTFEGQGKKSIVSTVDIEINERGQVFGGQTTFEELKTILNLREIHYQEAWQWAVQDHDKKIFSAAVLATSSLPSRSARSTSQYNVEYLGRASSWDDMSDASLITAKGISRAKNYFQTYRGIRPANIAPGRQAFILILPSEACHQLQNEDEDFQNALAMTLPRSEDHIFFKGHGLNPWGAWDGVVIVEDKRPVYGGTDKTFLTTEFPDDADYMKFQGLFMGAQGLGYAEWMDITWFERLWDHNRKFEVSVDRAFGAVKTVINLGTLTVPSNRDYGIGYLCGTALRIDD